MPIPYIVRRRARFLSICGPVNLPYGTEVEAVDGLIITGPTGTNVNDVAVALIG